VTWEQDRKIWLRDFLGKKIDNIQVLSFGYNSVINFEGWTHQLEDFSNQLLQAVTIYRRDSERVSASFSTFTKNHINMTQKLNRPIIFLGHSLGGLIIKKVRATMCI
jgi:surfactin synthase thioesterase subunit